VIYEECCKLKTKHIISFIQKSKIQSVHYERQSRLISECSNFIKTFNEQLIFTVMGLVEHHHDKLPEDQVHTLQVF